MLYDKRWDKTVTKAITQPDPFALEMLKTVGATRGRNH